LVEKNFDGIKEYENYIVLRDLFIENSMGIATGNDDELVNFDKKVIEEKYKNSTPFYYRPFDVRYTIFDNKILQRARIALMSNYKKSNLGLNIVRQSKLKGIETLISNNLTNRDFITNHTFNFPLYLYPETNPSAGSGQATQQTIGQTSTNSAPERTSNLNHEIALKIARSIRYMYDANVSSVNSTYRDTGVTLIAPLDILDYIYAVLHSPTYREKYKEFLKIDFPRIPYPKNAKIFWQLVKLGGEIRQIHLLESPTVEKYITQYPIDGDNVVIKPNYQNEKVYINGTQYFDNVPETAWNFYIGGYQPAQKWLKDRKERKLEFDDILHYQKIIVALSETDRLMKEIEKIEIE